MKPYVMSGFRDFPPPHGRILVPLGSRPAALAGLEMYAACRPRALRVQRLVSTAVRIFGAWTVPGRRGTWSPGMSVDDWEQIRDDLRQQVGSFDSFPVFRPSQEEGAGFGLLLMNGERRLGYAKFRAGISTRLESEAEAQALAASIASEIFQVARPISFRTVAGWSYLLMEPLPSGGHRPALDAPISEVIEGVQQALTALPRPEGTPGDWVPMHGDLTPWNVRRLPDRNLGLLDWENAGWAPQGADFLLWDATRAMLLGSSPARARELDEAREFWLDRLEQSAADGKQPSDSLRRALVAILTLS